MVYLDKPQAFIYNIVFLATTNTNRVEESKEHLFQNADARGKGAEFCFDSFQGFMNLVMRRFSFA